MAGFGSNNRENLKPMINGLENWPTCSQPSAGGEFAKDKSYEP